MMWNSGESDFEKVAGPTRQLVQVDPVHQDVQGQDSVVVPGVGTGGESATVTPPVVVLTPDEKRMMHDFDMFRARLHDVPGDRFERVLQDLRDRKSISSIARALIEEGFLAHLTPTSIRVYLTKIRDSLGLPGYAGQAEEIEKVSKEDETDEPIEGQSAIKTLRWLSRLQSSRVRKALKLGGMMGGMLLPQAASEIRLMSILVDKELEVALKSGEMKPVSQKVEVETNPIDTIVKTPAEAVSVLLAYRRLMKMKDQVLAAAGPGPEAERSTCGMPGEHQGMRTTDNTCDRQRSVSIREVQA